MSEVSLQGYGLGPYGAHARLIQRRSVAGPGQGGGGGRNCTTHMRGVRGRGWGAHGVGEPRFELQDQVWVSRTWTLRVCCLSRAVAPSVWGSVFRVQVWGSGRRV